MRVRLLLCALLLASASAARAQSAPAPQTPADAPLPVRRVVLYKTGVGYFEHLGDVRGRQNVTIRFTSAQLDDVLKSLTTIDLGKGTIAGISYNSIAPIEQRLGGLRLPLARGATTFDLLASLRGARLEVIGTAGAVSGRLLIVERQEHVEDGRSTQIERFSIVTDAGEVRTFDLTPGLRVRMLDRDLRQEVSRYLDVVGSARDRDVRSMVIATSGEGERPLFVSYISEVPIWKSTYRLVLPEKTGQPLLQGWAIVDNTVGEDWTNVELSLVAGAPQSFIQHVSQPLYGRRPVVPMAAGAMMTPQTHQATLTESVDVLDKAESRDLVQRQRIATTAPGGMVGGVVGGLPEAPPPPPPAMPRRVYENQAAMQPASAASGLGDLFEYRIKEPVTLRQNESALVPIVNTPVAAEKIALWNRGASSGRPLRAVWLTNNSNLTLDGGSLTVIDANAFAGEGLIEPLKPGEKRLVSYAAELGVLVSGKQEPSQGRVSRVRARDGIIIHQNEERSTSTYTARNENAAPVTLIVEHRRRPDWQLADGVMPAETTADSYRFRVVVDAGKEQVVTIREVHAGETRVLISELADSYVAEGMRSNMFSTDVRKALEPVLDKRAEIAGLDRQVTALQAQLDAIVQDQSRLRENMKALRGSEEERQLLQRYTRQLDEQETRLERLRGEIAQATARRDKAREEMSALIAAMSFDMHVGGKP